MDKIPQEVLEAYGIDGIPVRISPVHSGLINDTWKLVSAEKQYIVQKINHIVFAEPELIDQNVRIIANYLKQFKPGYYFIPPVQSLLGETMVLIGGEYYRLYPFLAESHTKMVVDTTAEAEQAAIQFGRFTAQFDRFDMKTLKVTIPFFHDLSYRYRQFLISLTKANEKRLRSASALISTGKKYASLVAKYETIVKNPEFRQRVTHHDTKISNVLFDKDSKGLCVIDLDTLMPGYFISDVGDMMRTYLSPVSEEETDFSKIEVREDIYDSIVSGYLTEMHYSLTETEMLHFYYAGEYSIYLQAIRFLTDYLNDDVYYGSKYPAQNLNRAGNQFKLLEKFRDSSVKGSAQAKEL